MRRLVYWLILALSLPLAGNTAVGNHPLTLEDRVEIQAAIERVHYSYRVGATRTFEEAVPRGVLERKVRKYLKQSAALDRIWNRPVTAEALSRELERIAGSTVFPQRLQQVYNALDNDSFLIQETFARQTLVDRLTRSFFAADRRIHAGPREQAEDIREALIGGTLDAKADHPYRSVLTPERPVARRLPHSVGEVGETIEERHAFVVEAVLSGERDRVEVARYAVPKISWDDWWAEVADRLVATEVHPVAVNLQSLPIPQDDQDQHGAVFERSALEAGERHHSDECPPLDTWDRGNLHDVPTPRFGHTAVWTGNEMIIWGGEGEGVVFPNKLNTGGRYDPLTDTWTAVSMRNAPEARDDHTAVWTGTEMVVGGGSRGPAP